MREFARRATTSVSVNIWLESPPGTSLPDLVREALAEAGRGFA